MKRISLWMLGAFLILQTQTFGQNSPTSDLGKEAVQLASYWFESISKAESIEKIMDISNVPFALDDKKLLNTYKELWDIYEEVFSSKGPREIPKYKASIYKTYNEIYENLIPLQYYIIQIDIKEGSYTDDVVMITVAVQNKELKVVGMTD